MLQKKTRTSKSKNTRNYVLKDIKSNNPDCEWQGDLSK